MTRLTIKQTESIIEYFQDCGEYLDATKTREDIENIINDDAIIAHL